MSLKKRTVHIGKKTMWRWGQKLGWCSYNQRKTKSCWQPPKTKKKAKNRLFLSTSRRTNPDNDLNADFCLHNCDRLNLYCFNPPSLWWIKFVMADLGHKYSRRGGVTDSDYHWLYSKKKIEILNLKIKKGTWP